MGNGMDDAKVDYRKNLFHLQNTGEESFGRKCECDVAISKCIAKIPDTLFGCTSCNYNPNIQGYYAQGHQASSQEPSTSGGGLSINRSSDRSADEPISQNAVTTGSFGDKGRLNI